jgi:hypothetical protein
MIIAMNKIRSLKFNLDVRHRCPLSPMLCKLYRDDIAQNWQKGTIPFYIRNTLMNTVLFVDQAVLAASEDGLQRSIH